MRTKEVNASIVGRKCLGMVFGELVQGTITEVEETECSVVVYFMHASITWGDCTYTKSDNWARKADEFGSLQYLTIID